MAPPDIPFRADSAERLLQPQRTASRSNRYLAPFGACLIYAILLTPVLLEDILWPRAAPAPQEIPVEILVEPPPEKPPESPAPKPEPQSAAKPLDESPAYDTPRAPTNEKVDTEGPDKTPKAPPAPQPTDSPSPNPDKDKTLAAKPETEPQQQPQKEEAEQNSPEPAPDKPAEATPTGELSSKDSAQPEQHPEAEAQPEALPKPEANRLPLFASVPDLDFGAMAKAAPIAGGKAKATYLSIIYGMVMARLHYTPDTRAGGSRPEGTIVFSIDSMGNLIERSIVHPSGSHALDSAAYDAVGRASPFPRPPNGAPVGLRFTYGSN